MLHYWCFERPSCPRNQTLFTSKRPVQNILLQDEVLHEHLFMIILTLSLAHVDGTVGSTPASSGPHPAVSSITGSVLLQVVSPSTSSPNTAHLPGYHSSQWRATAAVTAGCTAQALTDRWRSAQYRDHAILKIGTYLAVRTITYRRTTRGV